MKKNWLGVYFLVEMIPLMGMLQQGFSIPPELIGSILILQCHDALYEGQSSQRIIQRIADFSLTCQMHHQAISNKDFWARILNELKINSFVVGRILQYFPSKHPLFEASVLIKADEINSCKLYVKSITTDLNRSLEGETIRVVVKTRSLDEEEFKLLLETLRSTVESNKDSALKKDIDTIVRCLADSIFSEQYRELIKSQKINPALCKHNDLHCAILLGDEKKATQIVTKTSKVKAQALIKARDVVGFTPFLYACIASSKDMVRLLWNYGGGFIDKNLKEQAFYLALWYKNYGVIKLFLQNNITLSSKYRDDVLRRIWTIKDPQLFSWILDCVKFELSIDHWLLFQVMCKGNLVAIQELIKRGCDINANYTQFPVWLNLVEKGHLEILDYLINKKLINVHDKLQCSEVTCTGCYTAAYKAAYKKQFHIFKYLVDKGIEDETPPYLISQVSILGFTKGLDFLLQHKQYISQKNNEPTLFTNYLNLRDPDGGMTPLMRAIKHERVLNMKCILKYDPDLTIKDNNGLTAVDWAYKSENDEIKKLMQEHQEKHQGNKSN